MFIEIRIIKLTGWVMRRKIEATALLAVRLRSNERS
jgi:hypothetical protein